MMAQIKKLQREKLKAILVDMDGTLADGMGLLFQTYLKFLNRYGYEGTEEEFKKIVGPAIPEVLATLKLKYDIPKSVPDLLEEYHQILREIYISKVPLFPGALEFIQYINQTSLKLVMVTSADREFAMEFLRSHQIESYFDSVITPEGLAYSKPASDIYERALEQLQITPDEAVAIEDSPNGILAALGADIYTIQIRHQNSAQIFHHEHCLPITGWYDVLKYFQEG